MTRQCTCHPDDSPPVPCAQKYALRDCRSAARKSKLASDYEAKSATWLANGNEQSERGNKARAQRAYDRAQYWLDKANAARGNN